MVTGTEWIMIWRHFGAFNQALLMVMQTSLCAPECQNGKFAWRKQCLADTGTYTFLNLSRTVWNEQRSIVLPIALNCGNCKISMKILHRPAQLHHAKYDLSSLAQMPPKNDTKVVENTTLKETLLWEFLAHYSVEFFIFDSNWSWIVFNPMVWSGLLLCNKSNWLGAFEKLM